MKLNKTISITQILILVIGIVAMTWMIGGEFGGVSAISQNCPTTCKNGSTLKKGSYDSQKDKCEFVEESCSSDKPVCENGECVEETTGGDELDNKFILTNPNNDSQTVTLNKGDDYDTNGDLTPDGAEKVKNGFSQFMSIASVPTSIYGLYEAYDKMFNAIQGGKLLAKAKAAVAANAATAEQIALVASNADKISLFAKLFGGKGGSSAWAANWIGSFLGAAAGAALVWGIFKVAGASPQNMLTAFKGAEIGFASGVIGAVIAGGLSNPIGWVALIVAAIVTAIWTLVNYQTYLREIITYQISAWQPTTGGDNCEKCNEFEFGCTEYQCHALGKSCEIINKGTEQEMCYDSCDNIKSYPIINASTNLSKLPQGYHYEKSSEVSPPDTGVKIISNKECIPPFSGLTLGVITDHPAYCKISLERKKNFKDIITDMDQGPINTYNHTKTLPNTATLNQEILDNALGGNMTFDLINGNEYEYYIKCEDACGNENPANFVIKFCVQDKDLTAPAIEGFGIPSGNYILFNQSNVTTQVYTNEPAECKWDFQDKSYDNMEYSMQHCAMNVNQIGPMGRYICDSTFTGIKNEEENKYYVRCRDRSEDNNTNSESVVYILKGSKLIKIDYVTINGEANGTTIKDARDVIPVEIKVKTFAGAEDGKATCDYFYGGSWLKFSNGGNTEYVAENTQTIWLVPENYNLPIRCFDIAGNMDNTTASFKVETDTTPPAVVRAYYESNHLKIITNEDCEKCVYSTAKNLECNYDFDDGTEMSSIDELAYYTDWTSNTNYYIKCKDKFTNYPLPNACTIIVNTFESY